MISSLTESLKKLNQFLTEQIIKHDDEGYLQNRSLFLDRFKDAATFYKNQKFQSLSYLSYGVATKLTGKDSNDYYYRVFNCGHVLYNVALTIKNQDAKYKFLDSDRAFYTTATKNGSVPIRAIKQNYRR